jgi:type IV secretory pathway VirB10-like protein
MVKLAKQRKAKHDVYYSTVRRTCWKLILVPLVILASFGLVQTLRRSERLPETAGEIALKEGAPASTPTGQLKNITEQDGLTTPPTQPLTAMNGNTEAEVLKTSPPPPPPPPRSYLRPKTHHQQMAEAKQQLAQRIKEKQDKKKALAEQLRNQGQPKPNRPG